MLGSKRLITALVCGAFLFGAGLGASALELTLAGIRLGGPAQTVLKRFGNPTRTTVGTVTVGSAYVASGIPGMPGTQATPGMGPMAALSGLTTGYADMLNSAMGGGQLPGLPGMSAPGMSSSPSLPVPGLPTTGGMPMSSGMPGLPGMLGTLDGMQGGQVYTEEQVTWTYDLANGTTLEFIVSESGRVIQITVGGDQPYAGSKTSKGIVLGSYYKDVIFKYGYPERHQPIGRFLRVSYADKHRAVFTFLGKKLVGITIALKPENE